MARDELAAIDLLHRLVMQERSVDLIELGPFLNLVYTDDEWYRGFPAEFKNRTIYDLANHRKPVAEPIGDIDSFLRNFDIEDDPFHFIVAFYAKIFPKFTVCDIGAQYGTSAMSTMLLLRSLRASVHMLSFEPGIAAALTPLNFHNNGFDDIIFCNAAAGPVDGYVPLHREFGHSENNRIVNPQRSREQGSVSVPVRCVRVDTVLREHGAFGPTVAKIDTQGGEPGVLAGMRDLLRDEPVSMLLEYTPGSIRNVVDPAAFVRGLLPTHVCFDIGVDRSHLVEVTADNADDHRDVVAASPAGWVDLLLVARSLPGADEICDRIRAVAQPRLIVEPVALRPTAVDPHVASRLQQLTNSMSFREAVALLQSIDLGDVADPGVLYHAGVCYGSLGQAERAIDLLLRAADAGFAAAWCAYHLGLFEMRRGRMAQAAGYYVLALIRDPARNDIYPLLQRLAPEFNASWLQSANAGAAGPHAKTAAELARASRAAGRTSEAAAYLTAALLFDPDRQESRTALAELAPDLASNLPRL